MKQSIVDINFMKRALQLAEIAGINAAPNPMVGAVIVYNSRIIGEGFHNYYGKAHAEVNAVKSVKDITLLNKSTIYVTLEPCSHTGKTPPCTDLIIQHQFKRVVIACQDSFHKVAGEGIARLKNAGINIELGVLEKEAHALNKRFFTFHEKKRPHITLKWAQTKDGFIDRLKEERTAGINWITQPETKTWVHQMRANEQAILVGAKTIINDDPQLNVRQVTGKSPHRFIVDPYCDIPENKVVFNDGQPTTVFVVENHFKNLSTHVEVIEISPFNTSSIINKIYKKNILSVFIEGGAYTINQFIQANLWDEAIVITGNIYFKNGILAPKLDLIPQDIHLLGNDQFQYFKNP